MLDIAFCFLSAFLFLFLFAYFPGKVFSRLVKFKFWWDFELILGLSLLALVLFFGRFLLPTPWLLGIYLVLILILSRLNKSEKIKKIRKIKLNWIIILVISLGVFGQAMSYLKPLFSSPDQIFFQVYNSHDQSWHTSLINALVKAYPPQVPGFSGQILKNYHYYYDLIIATNKQIFGGEVIYYIQVVYPLLISFIYGLSIYRLISLLTKQKLAQYLTVFLTYFSNNLSFLISPTNFETWQSNRFLLDQPIIFLFNLQTTLSIAVIFYLLIAINNLLKHFSFKKALLTSLFFVGLLELKVYSFIVLLIFIGTYFVYKRPSSLLKLLILIAIFTILILIFGFKPSVSLFNFQPGWLLSALFHQLVFPILPSLRLLNMPFLFLLFLIGNYSIRLLGLFYPIIKKKSFLANSLFIITLVSLALTLSGNQASSPYNIIQFAPYATVSLTILFVLTLTQLKFKKKTFLFLIILTLALNLPVSIRTVIDFTKYNATMPPLTQSYFELLSFLKTQEQGLTLSLVDSEHFLNHAFSQPLTYRENNLIGVVANQPSYITDTDQLKVLGIDYQTRLTQAQELKDNLCHSTRSTAQFIPAQNIKYLITAVGVSHCLDSTGLNFEIIYKNLDYLLFKVN